MTQLPKVWTDVLSAIQRVRPEAVIAGGALRDMENGRPVKDVDIFFRAVSMDDFAYFILQIMRMTGFGVDYTAGRDYRTWAEEVVGTAKTVIAGVEFNLIGLDFVEVTAETAANRCDFGLCQIAFDGAEFFHSPNYYHDVAAEQFTLVNNHHSEAAVLSSLKRYQRLSAKYDGWPMVILRPWEDFADD